MAPSDDLIVTALCISLFNPSLAHIHQTKSTDARSYYLWSVNTLDREKLDIGFVKGCTHTVGSATRCDEIGCFTAISSFQKHRRPSQVSPQKSQQCGQSATDDGMFSYSPVMFIAAMVIRNT